MKNIVYCLLLIAYCLTPSVVTAQTPETTEVTGEIIGGAGVIKYTIGSPNRIGKIQSIDERYTAAFSWDTSINKLWQYNRALPIGKRWQPSQFVQYTSGSILRYDTAYKFIVDTTNRQLFVCNKDGCINVTGTGSNTGVTVTVANGLNMFGNEVKLGGFLTQNTTITASANAEFRLRGLSSGTDNDSLMVIDKFSGNVKTLNLKEVTDNYYKRFNQSQTVNYNSGYSPTTAEDPFLVVRPPVTVNIGNNISTVLFNDNNPSYFVSAEMTVVLPELLKYNGSIRVIIGQTTATAAGEPQAFTSLSFAAGVNTSIITPSVFYNVLPNAIFEAQYFSDSKKWLVQKLN